MITVLVVAEQELVRIGLRTLLNRTADIRLIGEVDAGKDVLAEVNRLCPDVVLFDLQPTAVSGGYIVRQLALVSGGRRELVRSGPLDEGAMIHALTTGAHGFLPIDSDESAVIDAIRTVKSGRSYLGSRIANRVMARTRKRRGTVMRCEAGVS
ncbi:MAG: response regulator transcription factor [Nitrospira sp.]|nr:response regulator transcription factor [Nitrospira sp.]